MLDQSLRRNFCETTARFANTPGVTVHLANEPSGFASIAPLLFEVDATTWRQQQQLHEEAFGPAAIVVRCQDFADLRATIAAAGGNLTGTIHAGSSDNPDDVRAVADLLEQHVGRILFDNYPTGVEICHAMVHGGPYPATIAPLTTSLGTMAIRRYARPVAFQSVPDVFLPPALQDANPLGIARLVNGTMTREPIK